MTWAHPGLLALLALVPVVLLGAVFSVRARARTLQRLLSHAALGALVSRGAAGARVWQAVLGVFATTGVVLALAGPQLGFDWEQRRMEGVSIVVVLDVSRSMDAADVSPSRMERARRELEDLTRLLQGDAIGLVLFAEGAWTRIPLTTDYGTFLWATKDSDTGTIRAQGTALPAALRTAGEMLLRAPGTGKAILVLSDGEDHAPDAEVQAALGPLKEAGVRIYAIGVGETAGAPIPLPEGGFKNDAAGNMVMSHLDEGRLQALASATGGAYVRSVVSDDDIRGIYEGEIRGKLEASERGVRREKRPRDHYQWPLGVAAFALAASAALGIGRRPALALVLALAALASAPAQAGAREDGQKALAEERWEDAARLLGQARVEEPSDTELAFALGGALYRAGRYREAEQIFRGAAQASPTEAERALAQYNAGNAAYRGGRLDDALSAYEAAAAADPALAAATKNAEAVRKEIQARQSPPPPKPPDQPPQEGEDSGQDGEPSGEPQAGPPSAPGQDGPTSPPADPPTGEPQPDPSGEADPPADPSADPSAEPPPEGDPSSKPTSGEPGEPTGQEEAQIEDASGSGMTPEQASRLVESVPEGKPAVAVGGRSSERDW